ncbi:hypothetical protein [Halosimplex amylolyticum]|uniref:hypothetical protein n=1 Tax=Halosimplex amylolyticum TaxID=3396616 RepID=UPI003F5434D9
MTSGRHLVVLAGADAAAVDAMAAALRDDGTVRTAYSPVALRETLDDEVDAVLVESGLGDGSLETVLDDLRAHEADCQVAVLDSGAGRCQLGADAPVDAVVAWDEDAVRETVSELVARARYRRRLDEYYALAEERAAVADDDDAAPNRDRLDRKFEELRRELADGFRRIDDASVFDAALSPDERRLRPCESTGGEGPDAERSGETNAGDDKSDATGSDAGDDGSDATGSDSGDE